MTIDLLKNIDAQCPEGEMLLGLDVGKKTIGLAIGSVGQGIATPLHTITRTKFGRDMDALRDVIDEYEIGGFVVGFPVHMDGSEGRRAQSTRDFCHEMQNRLGAQAWIALCDERLSTVSADNIVDNLVEKRKTKINAKASGLIDKLAAQVILQTALDYLRASR